MRSGVGQRASIERRPGRGAGSVHCARQREPRPEDRRLQIVEAAVHARLDVMYRARAARRSQAANAVGERRVRW